MSFVIAMSLVYYFFWDTVYKSMDVSRLGGEELITNYLNPLTSTWPHLRCDVGLEEGEYRENCLCLAVLCTTIMVHKGTSGSYRSVDCIGL